MPHVGFLALTHKIQKLDTSGLEWQQLEVIRVLKDQEQKNREALLHEK